MILLNSLKRPNLDNDKVFMFPEEKGYFGAYKNYHQYAKALGQENLGMYWYSTHTLHFSVENFFKYAYCIIRESVLCHNSDKTYQLKIDLFNRKTFLFSFNSLKASQFSHDIKTLGIILECYTDAPKFLEFTKFIDQIPTDHKWVSERYTDNDDILKKQGKNLKDSFLQYENDFSQMLNTKSLFQGIS